MSWVIEKSEHQGSAFVVLLMIANHAWTDGTHACASIETLAAEARMSERGCRYAIERLERSGELLVERNAGPFGTNLYSIPGVVQDGFSLRGLPAKIAGRNKQRKRAVCGNLPAKEADSSGKSFAPEPKRAENQSQNLRLHNQQPSSTSCQFVEKQARQRKRFAEIRQLAKAAEDIIERHPEYSEGDVAESLKQWAAERCIPYFDAWPGAATPVEQAITIATERRKPA